METAETTLVVPPQYEENLKAHSNLETQAKKLALGIKDEPSYREACEFRVNVDRQKKAWAVVIKPAVQAAHQAHQRIKAVENLVAAPLDSALDILDPQISRWRVEQENARRIEQEKINRQLKKDEEDRRMKEAEELHKSGKSEEAEAILEAPIVAPQVVLPSNTKVAGISDRVYWSAEVFDLQKLCQAIAQGNVLIDAVEPNMKLLGGLARSMKDSMNAQWEKYGVRAVSRTDIAGGK
jgi:hypothetical protein